MDKQKIFFNCRGVLIEVPAQVVDKCQFLLSSKKLKWQEIEIDLIYDSDVVHKAIDIILDERFDYNPDIKDIRVANVLAWLGWQNLFPNYRGKLSISSFCITFKEHKSKDKTLESILLALKHLVYLGDRKEITKQIDELVCDINDKKE